MQCPVIVRSVHIAFRDFNVNCKSNSTFTAKCMYYELFRSDFIENVREDDDDDDDEYLGGLCLSLGVRDVVAVVVVVQR